MQQSWTVDQDLYASGWLAGLLEAKRLVLQSGGDHAEALAALDGAVVAAGPRRRRKGR